jgi:hypothetical protein
VNRLFLLPIRGFILLIFLLLPTLTYALTPAQISQLATELNTDPAGLGYSPLVAAGRDAALVDALNQVRPGGAYAVDRERVPTYAIFAAVDAAEFLALTSTQLQQLTTILNAGQVDLSNANIRNILVCCGAGAGTGIFANPSATRSNLIALAKRQGSRAEVLWGSGTVVTVRDVSLALRNTQ